MSTCKIDKEKIKELEITDLSNVSTSTTEPVMWTKGGSSEALIGRIIQSVEFKEPVLQKIYDKIMKLARLVEEKREGFSEDLEYVLRAHDGFVKNRGYLNRESFQKLNELWKNYK